MESLGRVWLDRVLASEARNLLYSSKFKIVKNADLRYPVQTYTNLVSVLY
jgi:hypothetical protein